MNEELKGFLREIVGYLNGIEEAIRNTAAPDNSEDIKGTLSTLVEIEQSLERIEHKIDEVIPE